jgi:hypothetical protein
MTSGNTRGRVTGLVFNPWNLVLLLPFIILLTPIYNRKTPEFIGMPFFYWFQFLIIALGVLSTITVYRMTRKVPAGARLAEPVAEPVAEPRDEPVVESRDEPVVESKDEPVAETVAEPKDEPVAETKDEPKDADSDGDENDEGSVR